ncbi:unnamed protein product [Pedinophyceae sp. YPF-701]|nr:unnamed protein product [Pedinophyceae sp. YPF-701]
MLDESKTELVSNFVAVTGAEGADAQDTLEACGWRLEDAVQLYFAAHGESSLETDEKLARRLQAEATGGAEQGPQRAGAQDGDEIRAAIPQMTDRLYGSQPHQGHLHPVSGGGFLHEHVRRMEQAPQAAAMMFPCPDQILTQLPLSELQHRAADEDKWVVVNVQEVEEFDSHALNRDLWSNEQVQAALAASSLFNQYYVPTSEAQRISTFYSVERNPVIIVLDPITGQQMKQVVGQVSPEAFISFMEPFMSNPPSGAGAFLSKSMRPASEQTPGSGAAGSRPCAEEQTAGDVVVVDDTSADDEADIRPGKATADACSTPVEPLAEEPPAGHERSCRVALRLPDGRRLQRRFLIDQPVRQLLSWAWSELPDSTRDRPFELKEAKPGAAPLLSSDSIESSGAANSALVLRWVDGP